MTYLFSVIIPGIAIFCIRKKYYVIFDKLLNARQFNKLQACLFRNRKLRCENFKSF